MQARKGSKLSRTETFAVRFDPILKWAAELAAGRERRTMSSFVEWCVEQGVRAVTVARDADGREVSAWDVARECWHADPAQRLQSLAGRYFDALTVRERKILGALILLKADERTAAPVGVYHSPEVWDALERYADDAISRDDLIGVVKARLAA